MNSNYILIEIFCCINSNFDPGNTPNQIYPSLAINEMCNYITACCCHLENWYFVTNKLSPYSLNPFLSCFIDTSDIFYEYARENYSEENEDHHYTDSCIACQFTFLSAKMSCDRDCFQGWYTHSAVMKLLSNDVQSVLK